MILGRSHTAIDQTDSLPVDEIGVDKPIESHPFAHLESEGDFYGVDMVCNLHVAPFFAACMLWSRRISARRTAMGWIIVSQTMPHPWHQVL